MLPGWSSAGSSAMACTALSCQPIVSKSASVHSALLTAGPVLMPSIVRSRRGTGGAVVNVVVTGGAGFLGSRLARELLSAGSIEVAGGGARPLSRVTLLDQAPPPGDLAADERVTVIHGDLGDVLDAACSGRDALAGADVVFH